MRNLGLEACEAPVDGAKQVHGRLYTTGLAAGNGEGGVRRAISLPE